MMLVSAICPTRNRRRFIPQLLDCFFSQTWEEKELVLVIDGEEIEDLLPDDPRVRYARAAGTIGFKRNYACALARGEVIVHFDDDDWSAPDRIAGQLADLEHSSAAVTGFHSLLFWDERDQRGWRYAIAGPFACGTSLMYRRAWWTAHKFEDKSLAEDNAFVHAARIERQLASYDGGQAIVARIHAGSTSPHNLTGGGQQEYRPADRAEFPPAFFPRPALVCSGKQGETAFGFSRGAFLQSATAE